MAKPFADVTDEDEITAGQGDEIFRAAAGVTSTRGSAEMVCQVMLRPACSFMRSRFQSGLPVATSKACSNTWRARRRCWALRT